MATRKKTWRYSPTKSKKSKPKVPENVIQYLQEKGDEIVEKVFKPEYLMPVTNEKEINQIVDIYTKWHRNSFYFCVKYKCPPGANRTFLENKFVKFEYLGDDEFRYSYMRHTGKWHPTFKMTADECLKHATTEFFF
jgi:hypothetical protein